MSMIPAQQRGVTFFWHNNKTGQPVTRSLIAYDH